MKLKEFDLENNCFKKYLLYICHAEHFEFIT